MRVEEMEFLRDLHGESMNTQKSFQKLKPRQFNSGPPNIVFRRYSFKKSEHAEFQVSTKCCVLMWFLFRYEGQRYGHILDPRTGWPVQDSLSVTVIAPSAMLADVLSTAFLCWDLKKQSRWFNSVLKQASFWFLRRAKAPKSAPCCTVSIQTVFSGTQTKCSWPKTCEQKHNFVHFCELINTLEPWSCWIRELLWPLGIGLQKSTNGESLAMANHS